MKNRALTFNEWSVSESKFRTEEYARRQREIILRSQGIDIEDNRIKHWNIIVKANHTPLNEYLTIKNEAYKLFDTLFSRMEKFNLHDSDRSFRVTVALKDDADRIYNFIKERVASIFTKPEEVSVRLNEEVRTLPGKLNKILYDNVVSVLPPDEVEGILSTDILL